MRTTPMSLAVLATALIGFPSCSSESDPAGAEATPAADVAATEAQAMVDLFPADEGQPRSLLVHPSYLDEEPPPGRAISQIRLVWAGAPGVSVTVERTFEQTRELAHEVVAELRAGADFGALARQLSADRSARFGGVWGTVTPGVLTPAINDWVFGAELEAVSEPFQLASSFLILKRIERFAACRTIQIDGTHDASRAQCEDLAARVAAGESFEALAREHSDDAFTAARGGALAIFERTREDAILRAAAFALPVGGVSGPILSPVGWHLVQRVPIDELDPSLHETRFVRARAILIQYSGAVGATVTRWNEDAEALCRELHQRVLAGEDMGALAREFSEDTSSPERGGDLGWLHRGSVQVPQFMTPLFREDVGALLEPFDTTAGWLLLRREQ